MSKELSLSKMPTKVKGILIRGRRGGKRELVSPKEVHLFPGGKNEM